MFQDVQLAFRAVRRSPVFALTTIASLALALAATAAVFTLVDAVLLRPLSYPDPNRLVAIRNRVDGMSRSPWGLSQAQYFDFAQHASSLEGIGVYVTNEFTFADSGGAERVTAALVSASLFEVLEARPALGRLIREDDTRSGASPVVVLGHDFWVRRLGGDPAVIGRVVQIEARAREVVGVLPQGVDLPDRRTGVWLPLTLDPAAPPVNSHFLGAIGRLRKATSLDLTRAELDRLVQRYPGIFPRAYPPSFMRDSRFAPEVVPLHEAVVGGVTRTLWVLLGAAGLVLLIACANVANLFLVRLRHRWHEVEIRTALGAKPGHIARLSLAEALLLTMTAGALAIQIADAGLGALLASEFVQVPRVERIEIDWRVLLLTATLSAAAGVGLGLLPVVRLRVAGTTAAARHRGMTSSRGAMRLQNALVVAQVALTVVLLSSGGLMARSFTNLLRVDSGIDPTGVLAVAVSLPAAWYGTHERASRFYESLVDRVGLLPDVASAGATTALPLSGVGGCYSVFVEDAPLTPGENPPCLSVRRITPGYFDTLRIAVRGSTPSWLETNAGIAGVVVTRALAERLWPGQDPIGKGIRGNGWARPFYRVVGVAENVREAGLDQPPVEAVYFPMIPMEGAPLWSPARAMTLVVRARSANPEALVPAIRSVMNDLDRSVPLGSVTTMTDVVERSMARTTIVMLLLGIAAALALLLGAVGLYGLLAYTVSSRQREIGIRAALGCGRGELARLIVRQALALTGSGALAGVAAAAVTTRVLENLLFGISAMDPATVAAACLLLVLTAFVASYVPARRAATVDPMVVLRAE